MRLRTLPSPSASMSPFILIIVISCLLTTVMPDLVSSASSRSSRSSETKKEAPELLHQTASSNNIASEQRVIPNYHSPPSEREDAYSPSSKHRSSSEPRSNIISTSSSETSLRTGLGSSSIRGYGYPHLIAPTLPPFLSSRIDSFENDAIPHSPLSIDSASDNPKRSSSHRGLFDDDDDDDDDLEDLSPKRRGPYLKKHKKTSSFYDEDDDDSIESFSFSPPSDGYSSYREPRYRNFADLDSGYKHRPRDYDVPVSSYGSYGGSTSSSPYSSEVPTSKSRPPTSPRDPYLSPSSKPTDGFYPKVPKDSSYSSLYGPSRKRSRGYKSSSFDSSPPPSRGYGSTSNSESSYGSSHHHDDDDDDFQLSHGGYVKSHKYNGGPKLHSDTSYKSPRGGSSYGSEFLARDNPIVGDTRKRLLDYAGASDIYMGEPDYLGGTARKPLFGGLEDDYYGRGRRVNLKDFLFDESKNIPVRAKRQVRENTRFIKAEVVGVVPGDAKSTEAKIPSIQLQSLSHQEDAPSSSKDIPNCARNSSLSMCLTDNEYPTEAVGKAVAENMQLLLQMSGGNIEVVTKGANSNKKKPTSVDDEGKPLSVCPSSKGDANPVRAKDTQGVWRIIVNEEGVQQSVFMDVCRFPEEPCEFVPSAIATKCIQKFSSQTLLTYDAEEGLAMHEFPIPSACSCSVGRLIRIRSS